MRFWDAAKPLDHTWDERKQSVMSLSLSGGEAVHGVNQPAVPAPRWRKNGNNGCTTVMARQGCVQSKQQAGPPIQARVPRQVARTGRAMTVETTPRRTDSEICASRRDTPGHDEREMTLLRATIGAWQGIFTISVHLGDQQDGCGLIHHLADLQAAARTFTRLC